MNKSEYMRKMKSKAPGIIGELIDKMGGKALADWVGVTRPTLYNWANNRTPVSGQGAARIAVACKDNGVRPTLYVIHPSMSGGVKRLCFVASLPEGWMAFSPATDVYDRRVRLCYPMGWLKPSTAEEAILARTSGWPY